MYSHYFGLSDDISFVFIQNIFPLSFSSSATFEMVKCKTGRMQKRVKLLLVTFSQEGF